MTQIKCKNGELVELHSIHSASWSVQPEMYNGCFLVFNQGRTCVFASPECGKVTFQAVSVNRKSNGLTKTEHIVFNGVEPSEVPVDQKKTEP
ncbi:MAG: hypothetical protein IJF84_07095 [Thermoguttaceae bacterium]|nr:hypothetical protein [Thermoguttaceae bacterium]